MLASACVFYVDSGRSEMRGRVIRFSNVHSLHSPRVMCFFSVFFARAQITLISHAQLLPTLFGLLAVPSAASPQLEVELDPRRQLCGATALAALLYNQVRSRGVSVACLWPVCGPTRMVASQTICNSRFSSSKTTRAIFPPSHKISNFSCCIKKSKFGKILSQRPMFFL
jgi:hypothetical protein